RLTTRRADDPTIALLDAGATMLDVLTFYQERIANEGFLRTATERLSILELARAIGYELNPGVAAGTFLAFELETAPGAPGQATVPIGTKVQSLPGQDEQAQTFETVEEMAAQAIWNRLRPQTFTVINPALGDTKLYLQGTATNLKPGDALLLVGYERTINTGSERWDFRLLKAVKVVQPTATAAGYTVVTLERALGSLDPFSLPTLQQPQVYALRLRANLFGYNAPDWRTLPDDIRNRYLVNGGSESNKDAEWPNFTLEAIGYASPQTEIDTIYLDALYPQIVQDSWLVLSRPSYEEVYAVAQVDEAARQGFTLNAKSTRLKLSGENLKTRFNTRVRETVVFAQSEALALAAQPITEPLEGDTIGLDQWLAIALTAGRTLIVSGKAARVRVLGAITLQGADGASSLLAVDDTASLASARLPLPNGQSQWRLTHKNGFTGTVIIADADTVSTFQFIPAIATDPVISEVVVLKEGQTIADLTVLVLEATLINSYDRTSVTIYANVTRATHGETRREVLGSGDAAGAFQSFTLKQPPLTYLSAQTASGAQSTLEVRVNDVRWDEAASLYTLAPHSRAYVTRRDDAGQTTVYFGDGIHGARLPTGDENVSATYRNGLGAAGMVKAGQLSLLMTRPLGVQKVINPLAPTGAADPEARDGARRNAPFTVLTLDRIVSLRDFADFARAFTGIGKAQTALLWDGEQRLVHLTVAAATPRADTQDYSVDLSSDLALNLRKGIDGARDTVQRLEIQSYSALYFAVEGSVRIDPAYLAEKVLAAVTVALQSAYAFEARDFAQPVHKSAVLATMQGVAGVQAAFLSKLYLKGQTATLE
ncbi:MAG: putative baseplate assembly protein, partial [Chloroflexota bacterium]|nr:putative baseplate assembly protein [Chloroflexota bacterium]